MRRNARKYVGIDASICEAPCDESRRLTNRILSDMQEHVG
jgi:hypothetical protein